MKTKTTSIAIAVLTALATFASINPVHARPNEAKWIMKCCGQCGLINTMPNPDPKDIGKCERFNDNPDNCTPEAAITIDAFVSKPMKPKAGENANVFVSISNIGDGIGVMDVTLTAVCNNGDTTSITYEDQQIGVGETRHDLVIQWKTTSMTDCTITAHVTYNVASCDTPRVADNSFQMWVDAPEEPTVCVCEPGQCTPCTETPTCEDLNDFCSDICGVYDLKKTKRARYKARRQCERNVDLPGRYLCERRIRRCYVECVQ